MTYLVDSLPFEKSHPENQNLLELLYRVIGRRDQITLLAELSGVDVGMVDLSGGAKLVWLMVLSEARLQNKLRRLLEQISKDMPALAPTISAYLKIQIKISGPGPVIAVDPVPAPGPKRNKNQKLTLLHLSDLHFGHGNARTRFDQRSVVNKILADVRGMVKKLGFPDWIVLTGDVAFSAQQKEYTAARAWIDKLLVAAGQDESRVLVVPGNHDVDRGKVRSPISSKMLHEKLRQNPEAIDEFIADKGSMKILWPKLKAYCNFSRDFRSPNLKPSEPFWMKSVRTDFGRVVFVGLNTVLLSCDGNDSALNLMLGKGQIVDTIETLDDGGDHPLVIVLQHHPPQWLRDGGYLSNSLKQIPHMLICGHVHEQGGLVAVDLNNAGLLKMVGGAGHLSGGEEGSHGFSWIQITPDELNFYPRIWERRLNKFVADRNFYEDISKAGCVSIKQDRLPNKFREWQDNL